MLLPPMYNAVDGDVGVWLPCQNGRMASPIIASMTKFAFYIEKKHISEYDLTMSNWFTRCNFAGVVRHLTDAMLEAKNTDLDKLSCKSCRGKGHSWKAQILNGKPFIVNDYTEIKDWNNPDWCRDCNGTGQGS